LRASLAGIPVGRAMVTKLVSLPAGASLARAVEIALAGFQHDFPVVDEGGRLVGLTSRVALARGLAAGGTQAVVADVMRTDPPTVEPDEPLDQAVARLDEGPIVVIREDRPIGMLTPEAASGLALLRGQ
jgi:CBS domain-containing protein